MSSTTTPRQPVDESWADVARFVFPAEDVEEVVALYLELPKKNNLATSGIGLESRHSISATRGTHVSLGTYFNSFPASPWRLYTPVRTVRLTGRFEGSATVQVWKSSARGRCAIFSSQVCEGDFAFDLPISAYVDGGFYWLEFTAESDVTRLVDARWQAPTSARRIDGRLSVGITTFNRAPYCIRQLQTIAGDETLREFLDTVYVVDQGTDLVSRQDAFSSVAAELGDQLTMLRQGNLGGSGGFSRSMYETLEAGKSDYVLLLDDDAILEPESALRAMRFGDFATTPTIVGGGMLHLDRRSILYGQGERIDFIHGRPTSDFPMNQDFERKPLRSRPKAHLQRPVEYNGWWMCLIPRAALETVGLSLPLFLKWDDIEFGVRAGRAGIPTVGLFGAAVWHQAWHDKNLLRTWEEYFSHRNTCLALLATSPSSTPLKFVQDSFAMDVLLILLLQYSSVHVRNTARVEAMGGLLGLHDRLPTTISYARSLRNGFADHEARAEISDFPPVVQVGGSAIMTPRNDVRNPIEFLLRVGAELFRHCFIPPRKSSRENPEVVVASSELSWWQVAGYDSAVVTSADGAGFTWTQRDPKLARKLLLESIRSNLQLQRRWPQLKAQIAQELPQVAAPQQWVSTFAASAVEEH